MLISDSGFLFRSHPV